MDHGVTAGTPPVPTSAEPREPGFAFVTLLYAKEMQFATVVTCRGTPFGFAPIMSRRTTPAR